jgi:hypothetical protein
MIYSTYLQKSTFFSAELQAKASLYAMQCIMNKHSFLFLILDATPVDFPNMTLAPSEANDISLFVKLLKKNYINYILIINNIVY